MRKGFMMMLAGIKDIGVLNGDFQSRQGVGFEASLEEVPEEAVG